VRGATSVLLDVEKLIANTNPRMTPAGGLRVRPVHGRRVLRLVHPAAGRQEQLPWLPERGRAEAHDYEIHFPYVSTVKLNALALENRRGNGDPAIEPTRSRTACPAGSVFYGSSITHGACRDRPGIIYRARHPCLERRLHQHGLRGTGKGEPEVRGSTREHPRRRAYVLDWGINLCSPQEVNLIHDRYHPLLKKLKKAKPDVPILLVNMQGAGAKLDKEMPGNLEILHKEVKRVYDAEIAAGNKKLWYVDGQGHHRRIRGVRPHDRPRPPPSGWLL